MRDWTLTDCVSLVMESEASMTSPLCCRRGYETWGLLLFHCFTLPVFGKDVSDSSSYLNLLEGTA